MREAVIPKVHLSGTVRGQSLQACVNKAIEQCETFFGTDREYTLEPLHCRPQFTLGEGPAFTAPVVPDGYEAIFQAYAA